MRNSFNYPLKKSKRESRDDAWKLAYKDFQPAKEMLREALCTVGNGYFGTRGAATESSASRIHYPGTYIAGVYNKLSTNIAGKTVTNEDFVNCPNWLYLTFKSEHGKWIVPSRCKVLHYYQELDIYKGTLIRSIRLRSESGFIFTIRSQTFAHMENPHLGCIRYVIRPEDYEGKLIIRSGLDGTVENEGVARYRQLESKHLMPRSSRRISSNKMHLSVETSQSGIVISQTAQTRIFSQDRELHPRSKTHIRHKKAIFQDFELRVEPGEEYEVEKIVSLYSSNLKYITNPRQASINSMKVSHRFCTLFSGHVKAWRALWKKFDVEIEGDATYCAILRLHTFHLLQSASYHRSKIDAGLPARGLHGEAYRGHIFWDQLFIMPFYNLRAPEISKELIKYRYRRLSAARRNAEEEGHRGAMFPWQSGSDGDEQSQKIHLNPMSGKWGPDNSAIQRHISFDIAHNVWSYWVITQDTRFLERYGAEIILSVAQYGSSISKYRISDGRYHTEGLMGPDEFHDRLPGARHPGFEDNAYTNVMIAATLDWALKLSGIISKKAIDRLFDKLSIHTEELSRWKDITRKMKVRINKDGIIEQFAGYFGLKELDWEKYRKKYGNIHRLDRILKAEGKSANDYKAAKQADVLMLFYLFTVPQVREIFKKLGYKLDRVALRKNYEYYIKRTSHGSTLSKVVHCYIAHILNRPEEALRMYQDVLRSDVQDIQGGTTPEGVHTGVMGGSVNIALESFAGVRVFRDYLVLNPSLPNSWRSVRFRVLYKGNWVLLRITRREISLFIPGKAEKKRSLTVKIYGKEQELAVGRLHKIKLKRGQKMEAGEGMKMAAQERVLVVDGDIMQGVMLKTRLEDSGYLADFTYKGSEALEILKTEWVDLIMMGVSLYPGISGYQLFKEIKRRKEYASVPIIIQSGKSGMKKSFEKMGIEAFFVKPYDVNRLIEKVNRIIKSKK